jgi:acyl-CoA synthetase (AMP-forming)/AMP-acid ligase II
VTDPGPLVARVVFAEALPQHPSGKVLKRTPRETYAAIVDEP